MSCHFILTYIFLLIWINFVSKTTSKKKRIPNAEGQEIRSWIIRFITTEAATFIKTLPAPHPLDNLIRCELKEKKNDRKRGRALMKIYDPHTRQNGGFQNLFLITLAPKTNTHTHTHAHTDTQRVAKGFKFILCILISSPLYSLFQSLFFLITKHLWIKTQNLITECFFITPSTESFKRFCYRNPKLSCKKSLRGNALSLTRSFPSVLL